MNKRLCENCRHYKVWMVAPQDRSAKFRFSLRWGCYREKNVSHIKADARARANKNGNCDYYRKKWWRL